MLVAPPPCVMLLRRQPPPAVTAARLSVSVRPQSQQRCSGDQAAMR